MATFYKRDRSPFYYVAWFDAAGKRHYQSTGTTDAKEAAKVAATFDKSVALALQGRLTPDKAREILAEGLENVFLATHCEAMPKATVRNWSKQWLDAKRIETAPTTVSRYEGILERFCAFLGAKADKDVVTVTAADVGRFRDSLAKELSRSSANLSVKTLRVMFGSALKQGLVTANPAAMVDKLKTPSESKRRPFTMAEVKSLLATAGKSEWRGLIMTGIYTGARLGDIARLTWNAVKLDANVLTFVTGKTGRRMVMPLAPPLADYFTSLSSTDDPNDFVFPKSADAAKRTGTLSNRFYTLMAEAGLAKVREKKQPLDKDGKKIPGKGRNTARPVGELSFHCLRHSFVTFLKAAGANEAVAMALAGHETKAISQNYTHLDTATLREAINKLPNVTKAGAK